MNLLLLPRAVLCAMLQGVLCMEVSPTIHEPSQQDRRGRKMSM
jgi:hypothetical protein